MSTSGWLCLLLLMFVLYLAVGRGDLSRRIAQRRRKKRRQKDMNELIARCVGKNCVVSMGGMGTDVEGCVEAVEESWVSIRTKKGLELVNLDYIRRIRVKEA